MSLQQAMNWEVPLLPALFVLGVFRLLGHAFRRWRRERDANVNLAKKAYDAISDIGKNVFDHEQPYSHRVASALIELDSRIEWVRRTQAGVIDEMQKAVERAKIVPQENEPPRRSLLGLRSTRREQSTETGIAVFPGR